MVGGAKGIRLRTLTTAGGVALIISAAVACGGFAIVAFTAQHGNAELHRTIARMRATTAARVDLLTFARQSDVSFRNPDPALVAARERAREALVASFAAVAETAKPDDDRALAARANSDLRQYLRARADAEQHAASLRQVLPKTTPRVTAIFDALNALSALQYRDVERAQQHARQWNLVGSLAALAAGALAVLVFLAALVALRRLVVEPLLSLSDTIHRFARGDRSARVSLHGVDEFRNTASEFNSLVEALARHEEDERTLLAGVAHDLRNPLSAMRMRIDMLTRADRRPTLKESQDALHALRRHLTRLDRLVGDLVDAKQLERGALELHVEAVDLRSPVRDVADLYIGTTPRHLVAVRLPDSPVVVDCDRERIEQVLTNLVSNAFKYSPSGGEVSLELTTDERGALVSVRDSGIGIRPEELPHIFEPFRRSSDARRIRGTGLGLSVARRLVEAHGGTLDVVSEPDAGSTFRVHLPLGDGKQQHSHAS